MHKKTQKQIRGLCHVPWGTRAMRSLVFGRGSVFPQEALGLLVSPLYHSPAFGYLLMPSHTAQVGPRDTLGEAR